MIPATARRINRGLEREVPLSELAVEQLVLVHKEEYFPVDGVITEGTTTVDERTITGRDTPVEKFPSSRVYAGTRNLSGKVLVRISAIGEETIIRRTESFMQRQEQHAQRRSGIPERLLKLVRGRRTSAHEKIKALAGKGIFVAGGETLERLREVDTIVFDKTGIITTGAMHVMHVVSFKPYTQQQVLNTAAALEAHSRHLTARAIVGFAKIHGAAALQRVDDPKEERGLGVSGKLNGKTVLVGNAALLQKKKVKLPKEALEHKAEGETVIYVAADKQVLGYLALSNTLKANVKQVMRELKKHYRVMLLSGDHEETAAAIAMQANMHEVVAGVQLDRRSVELTNLKERGKTVAYVTAASESRQADVTVTMGTRAAFSGDITILHGDLAAIQTLFEEVKRK